MTGRPPDASRSTSAETSGRGGSNGLSVSPLAMVADQTPEGTGQSRAPVRKVALPGRVALARARGGNGQRSASQKQRSASQKQRAASRLGLNRLGGRRMPHLSVEAKWARVSGLVGLITLLIAVAAIIVQHHDSTHAEAGTATTSTSKAPSSVALTTLTTTQKALVSELNASAGGFSAANCVPGHPPTSLVSFAAVIDCTPFDPWLSNRVRFTKLPDAQSRSNLVDVLSAGMSRKAGCNGNSPGVSAWHVGEVLEGDVICRASFENSWPIYYYYWFSTRSLIVGQVASRDSTAGKQWWGKHAAVILD
jgi:hypothetical protein